MITCLTLLPQATPRRKRSLQLPGGNDNCDGTTANTIACLDKLIGSEGVSLPLVTWFLSELYGVGCGSGVQVRRSSHGGGGVTTPWGKEEQKEEEEENRNTAITTGGMAITVSSEIFVFILQ